MQCHNEIMKRNAILSEIRRTREDLACETHYVVGLKEHVPDTSPLLNFLTPRPPTNGHVVKARTLNLDL
jgi:hypothetical protein